MLRRTAYKGLNALHAAAGGEGLLPICRYLVEEAKMDVNKRDTFTGSGGSRIHGQGGLTSFFLLQPPSPSFFSSSSPHSSPIFP